MTKLDKLAQTLACTALVLAIARFLTGCGDTPSTAPTATPSVQPTNAPYACPTKDNPKQMCQRAGGRG